MSHVTSKFCIVIVSMVMTFDLIKALFPHNIYHDPLYNIIFSNLYGGRTNKDLPFQKRL